MLRFKFKVDQMWMFYLHNQVLLLLLQMLGFLVIKKIYQQFFLYVCFGPHVHKILAPPLVEQFLFVKIKKQQGVNLTPSSFCPNPHILPSSVTPHSSTSSCFSVSVLLPHLTTPTYSSSSHKPKTLSKMFEILFGWRKASKCKRLIKRVQFRLEVLKNKRDSIIRQLQQDVVHLIKTGHHSSAISRIEQIYKDQTIKAGYDLLHSFSEFIIINLSYIRKHRDCPNDINEAVSSLLYASARFGDLPELTKLRKLFRERYGQKFATTAVELLHGNLVNRQIIENLSVKSASDDLKLKLLKEIARDNGIQFDHHEINGVLELKCQQQSDIDDSIDAPKLQVSCEKEVHEIAKFDKSFDIEKNTVTSASARVWSCNSSRIHSVKSFDSELSASPLQHTLERITEVEPESPSHFSKRQLVYLDDAHDKEKSLLMVKSSITSVTQSPAAITHNDHKERGETYDKNSSSQGATKRKKSSRRRLKCEHSSMKDVEAALYYGEPDYLSPDDNLFSRRADPQGKHRQKMANAESQNSSFTNSQKKPAAPKSPYSYVHKFPRNCIDVTLSRNIAADCSLENPCYFITSDDQDDLKSLYSTLNSTKTPNRFPPMNLQQGKRHEDEHNFYCSSDEAFSHKACGLETNNTTSKMKEEAEVIDSRRSCPSSHNSSRVASPWGRVRDPYLRTMTMPTERTKETPSHRIVRSASCLPDQHNHSNIESPSYIHPKLPDYEDLSARFRSLKTKSVAM